MKPLRFELHNFLSYRKEIINLSELTYASIVGENGSGKTAISGAMGWAVFGTVRFKSGGDDSIVNDEATEARVVFDFEDRHGDVYRIDRFRSKKGKGKSELKFSARDESVEGGWKQLGDHTIAGNQAEINRVVGMNEDAFYSLVIMDQSSGGTKFISADVHKRRGILLSMEPQLARYAELERKASDKLKVVNKALDKAITRHESVQRHIDDTKERISKLGGGVPDDVWERTHPLERDFLPQRIDFEAEEGQLQAQVEKIAARIDELTRTEATANSTLEAAEKELANAKRKVEDDVEDARQKARAAEETLKRLKRLSAQRDGVAEDIDKATREQSDQTSRAEDALLDLEDAEADLLKATEDIEHADSELDRLDPLRRQRADEAAALKSSIEDLRHRREGLHDHDSSSGKCWVCESDLPAERAAALLAEVEEQIEAKQTALADIERRLNNIDNKMDELDADLRKARTARERAQTAKERAESSRTRSIERAESAQDRLVRLNQQLGELDEDLAEIDGDAARALVREVDAEVQRIRAAADEGTLAKLQERIEDLDDESLDKVRDEIDDLRRNRRRLGDELTALARKAGAKKEAEQNLLSLQDEEVELRTDRKELSAQSTRLAWLANAFAPKGIPSMLLDEVLAAIEDEQNLILAAMPSMEGMQVEFRQGRANKSGEGTKDTLDIVVHLPNEKERFIESFSYGQTTKLALSNIFAMIRVFNDRHGNLVRCVVADEFLSALDEGSIPLIVDIFRDIVNAQLVEGLYLVTHDPRLIEALPQQLLIEMTPEGSKAHVQL